VHVVEIIEMNDEDLYLLDDLLEEATNNYDIRKNWKKFKSK
jgi:hypothetical protein